MDKAQRSFLLVLAVAVIALAVAILQVPQPWRARLIGVLMCTPILALVAKIVRDVLEYLIAKAHVAPRVAASTPPPPIKARGRSVEVRRVDEQSSGPVIM